MEKPDKISKAVLDRGLDAQTAFAIVSIDIADIDVGQNIGRSACLRPTAPRADISASPAPRPKSAAPWPWPASRR